MVTRAFRRSVRILCPLLLLAACAPGNKLHVPGELSRPPRPGAPPAGPPVAAVADFSYIAEVPGVVGRDFDQVRQIVWKGEPGKAMADLVADALADSGTPTVRVRGDAPAPADVPVRISGTVRRFEVNARRGGLLNVLTEATVTLAITASGPGVSPSWESTVTSGTTLTDMFPTPDDLREALLSAANSAAEEAARRLLEGRIISAPSGTDKGGGRNLPMNGPGRRTAAMALLFAAILLASGCDSAKHKVEILESPVPTGDPPIKIASSDEAAPFFRKVADAYAARKRVRLELFETQSRNIPELLLSGSVDIGVTSGGIPAEAAGKDLSYVPFAHDAIAFIASPDAGVRSLTTSQIRRILSGEIDDWKEAGGKAGPIKVVDRPPASVTRVSLGMGLFDGKFPPSRHGVVAETSDLAIQAMRQLPGYFGFGPLSRLTSEQIPGVLVTVDGMPALAPVSPGHGYPARVEYGIMFRKDAAETVKELAGYFLTPEGGHELATLGLTPTAKGLSMAACHCRKQEGIFLPAGRKSVLAGTFTLAVVPELGAITQENRYSAILQRIADGMEVRTRLMHLSSYDQVIEEFHEGRIDAAFVGSLMYGKLRQRAGVIPLARPEKQGKSQYHGLILVRKADRFSSLAALRGKRLAYVPNTSAGELFARAMVAEAGGEWPGYFSKTVKASSHETAVELLLAGEVDVSAVKDLVLDRMAATRPALRKAFTVLSFSTAFPENALVVSQHLGETDRANLRRVLLSLHEIPGGLEALRSLGADRMIPTSDQDYAGMYGLARKVGYRLDGGG